MEAAAALTQGASGEDVELSDAELVALYCANGTDVAFSELIRRHQIAVFRLLLTLLGDPDEAERLCEQTFFEAARRLDQLKDPAAFHGFISGVARELVKKAQAARGRAKPPKKTRLPPPPRDPREAVKQQVQAVLVELSNDERAALVLADLEGDSYESIAATLGTSATDAERLVALARSKFIQQFAQGGEHEASDDLPADAGLELAPGRTLGKRFRIEEHLAEGGMGAVFRATDLQTGALVAIKTLLPEASKDAALRKRFEREAEILKQLNHPNFVHFVAHGGGGAGGEPAYVAMEFLDGETLSRVIKATSRLGSRRALHITRHILTGLRYAHEQGVIHRDVKPDNVVLVQEDHDPEFAKLLDFGIARLASAEVAGKTLLTQKGEIFGTPAYMAPEQVRGDEVDSRADLYAVSVMLYEMLASRPPFVAKNQMGLFAMHLAVAPPPLHEFVPEAGDLAPLQALLDLGLAKEPSERVASASEYLARIDALLATDAGASDEPSALRTHPTPELTQRREPATPGGATTVTAVRSGPPRTRRTAALVFLLLLMLAAAGLWLTHSPH